MGELLTFATIWLCSG